MVLSVSYIFSGYFISVIFPSVNCESILLWTKAKFFIEGLKDNLVQVEKSSEQFFVKKEKVKEVKSEYNPKKRQKLKKTDSSLPQVFT